MHGKILFIGPAGVGKSNAIHALSGRPPSKVSFPPHAAPTEAAPIAHAQVELDYALLRHGCEEPTYLMAIPPISGFGARLFEVWPHGLIGAVLLLDHARGSALKDLGHYLNEYLPLAQRHAIVVAVQNLATSLPGVLDEYQSIIEAMHLVLPVVAIRRGERRDLMLLLEALLANAEIEVAHASGTVPGALD